MTRFKHPQDVLGLLGSGTELADLFLQVRINGDVALLKGITKAVLAHEDALDRDFIGQYTTGFDEFVSALQTFRGARSSSRAESQESRSKQAAQIFVESERTIFCWAMGLTQHRNAVANIQEIVNLMLLRGQVGKPGAGLCPVRGHSNVQGDRTVGIWERPTEAFLDKLGRGIRFRAAAKSRLRHGASDPGDARGTGAKCSSRSAATFFPQRRIQISLLLRCVVVA